MFLDGGAGFGAEFHPGAWRDKNKSFIARILWLTKGSKMCIVNLV